MGKDGSLEPASRVALGRTSPDALLRRIYLSSTYSDLGRTRGLIAKAIERLQGHFVVGMESYLASDERPVDRCLADVATCDYYVGVFAWRYGFIPPHETQSITELEFREAIVSNKPRLIFVLDERAEWPSHRRDADPEQITRLRRELLDTHIVSLFKSMQELPLLAGIAIANQTLLEVRGLRNVAHQELREQLAHLLHVLVFLALLPYIASFDSKSIPSWMGEPLRNLDLQDRRLIDVLTKTSISPSRRLNGPYDSSVPFGTDRRFVDSIVSAETAAAEGKLRSALARYSAAELGVQALHATERILTHPFFGYLKKIRESAAMRREMEDSETIAVPILGSGIQGGSVADYRNFVDAIEILARAIRPPDI
jgi:hypothetical protein